MQHLVIAAPAKINLSLDVVGKREDGYHLLSTVMQSISLHDIVELTVSSEGTVGNGITIACDLETVPSDRRNAAVQAAVLFFAHEKIRSKLDHIPPVAIHIQKNIPVAAGLAGGSADAAAVLFGLNLCFPDLMTQLELLEIAAGTGADVPFCLQGGTVLCEGIGEHLSPLPPWPGLAVLLCFPGQPLLTAQVFRMYSSMAESVKKRRPDTSAVLQAVCHKDLQALAFAAGNVLMPAALRFLPEIEQLLRQLQRHGAILAQMSGSGPSVFGLFSSQQACRQAAVDMQDAWPHYRVITCLTQASGPALLS